MTTTSLEINEYNSYYQGFIDIIGDITITEAFNEALEEINNLGNISEDLASTAYAKGKWTIKDILSHLIDVERIFSYRALCIARGETSNLPGFDQDIYVVEANANDRTIISLINEFITVRKATMSLFEGLSVAALKRIGLASGSNISVRALGFIMCGHQKHHFQVIRTRYMNL